MSAAVELGDELAGVRHIRHDRVLEPTDGCLDAVASVEERDLFLCDEVVQLGGRDLRTATDHARLVDPQLRSSAAHELIAHPRRQSREVAARPSDHFASRSWNGGYPRVRVRYCLTSLRSPPTVPLLPSFGRMMRPADAERIAEFPLPEPQRRRVGERMNIQNSRIYGTTTAGVSIALCHGTVVRLLDE